MEWSEVDPGNRPQVNFLNRLLSQKLSPTSGHLLICSWFIIKLREMEVKEEEEVEEEELE